MAQRFLDEKTVGVQVAEVSVPHRRRTRRRPHDGFSGFNVSPAAAAGELFRYWPINTMSVRIPLIMMLATIAAAGCNNSTQLEDGTAKANRHLKDQHTLPTKTFAGQITIDNLPRTTV
jgi:hypothetical protein